MAESKEIPQPAEEMSQQTVPQFGGQEMASSLAELDFSILSDYQVPSPGTSSLPQLERSPPHLFSPQRDMSTDGDCEYAGYPAASPADSALSPGYSALSPAYSATSPGYTSPGYPALSPNIKQEFGQQQDACLSFNEMKSEPQPGSPVSDAGYSSTGGYSPVYQPSSPGYPQQQQPQQLPQDHQLLRQCLRDTSSLQRRLSRPAFNLEMLYGEQQALQQAQMQLHDVNMAWIDQLDSVFDRALESIRIEIKNVCLMLGISPDPMLWSPENVRAWVAYTCQQFNLPQPQMDWSGLDGRALCSLHEHQFKMCAPQSGETLFAQLEVWRYGTVRPAAAPLSVPWPAIKCEPGEEAAPLMATNTPDEDLESEDEEEEKVVTGRSGSHIHLWQFLKELLTHPQLYGAAIRWVDRSKGIFKIEDSVRVAKLWGKRKNRPAMNYDKLSRSIRQYYKKGIMKKTERSQRLVYQFCHPYSL